MCIIIKETVGGRAKINQFVLNSIVNSSVKLPLGKNRKSSFQVVDVGNSSIKSYEKVVLNLCTEKQIFHKMTEKLSINRYIDHEELTTEEQLKNENTLSKFFEILLNEWEFYKEHELGAIHVVKNPHECYLAIVSLEERLNEYSSSIFNEQLLNLHRNLTANVQTLKTKMI